MRANAARLDAMNRREAESRAIGELLLAKSGPPPKLRQARSRRYWHLNTHPPKASAPNDAHKWDFVSGDGLSRRPQTVWAPHRALAALAAALVQTDEWWAAVESVAKAAPGERNEAASAAVRRYCRRGSPRHDVMIRLALVGEREWPNKKEATVRLLNLGARSCFPDTSEPGDRERDLRLDSAVSEAEAAFFIARRGSERCVACGARLRAGHKFYCDPCRRRVETRLHDSRKEAVRMLFTRIAPLFSSGGPQREAGTLVPPVVPRPQKAGPGEVPNPAC